MTVVASPERTALAAAPGTRHGNQTGARQADRLALLRLVAHGGQATVITIAALVPYAAGQGLTTRTAIVGGVIAAIWLTALNRAFAAGYRALGVAPTAMVGTATGLVAVAAATALLPGGEVGLLTLAAMTAGVGLSAGIWETAVQRTSIGRRRVLLVGTEELADRVEQQIDGVHASFDVVGCVDAARASDHCLAGLCAVVEAQQPDLVVLADERLRSEAVDRLLDAPNTFRVLGLSTFFEYALGRVPLRHVTPAWFMAVLHLHQRPYARWSKRTFDLVVSGVALVLALPLLPVIALAVWTTGRPLIYRQTRLGERGHPFSVLKFRTMRVDAEAPGCPQFAQACDARVTTVGRFLRRTHLDELPQLWNVIRGDMSIVGPRPERPEFVTMLEASVPHWTRRLLVKPGVTGWAQVHAGYAYDCESAAEKLSYDLWYIRHRRLSVDIAVCLRTATMMLRSMVARGRPA